MNAKALAQLPVAKASVNGKYRLNEDIVTRIWLERLRQKDLLRREEILFDCASPVVCNDRKLRVLMEELGESAKEVDALEISVGATAAKKALQRLQTELTQVAAVAIAWLESIEEEMK